MEGDKRERCDLAPRPRNIIDAADRRRPEGPGAARSGIGASCSPRSQRCTATLVRYVISHWSRRRLNVGSLRPRRPVHGRRRRPYGHNLELGGEPVALPEEAGSSSQRDSNFAICPLSQP